VSNEVVPNFDDLYKAIALLLCKTPLTYKEFCKNLKTHAVKTAHEVLESNKVTDIANTTGIDRNAISLELNRSQSFREKSKLSILLGDLWKKKDQNNKIKWAQYLPIAQNILSSSLSPTKAAELLEKFGSVCVVRMRDEISEIEVVKQTLSVSKDTALSCEVANLSLLRHVHTMLVNIHTDSNLFQQDLRSSQVPPSSQEKLHEELFDMVKFDFWPKALNKIEKYEADVPPGTYPDCGLSAFEFYSNKKVEK